MLKKRVINKTETDRAYNARLLKNEDLYEHCEFCGAEYHEDDLSRGKLIAHSPLGYCVMIVTTSAILMSLSWRSCKSLKPINASIRSQDEVAFP